MYRNLLTAYTNLEIHGTYYHRVIEISDASYIRIRSRCNRPKR